MSKMTVRGIAIVAVLLLGSLAAVVFVVGQRQRSKAERLLNDLYRMKSGTASFAAARGFVTQYGGYSVGPCTKEKCRFDIVVSNEIYYKLRLARPKELAVTLRIEDDRLSSISFGLLCTPSDPDRYPLGYGVHIDDDSCYPCYEGQKAFMAKRNGTDSAHTEQILVQLTSASTLEQRRAAYGLDLDCLSELGDCPQLDKVAPAVWQEIERQTVY